MSPSRPKQQREEPSLEQKLERAGRLQWIDQMVGVLDDRFRIPGTRIRFGLDALIGLVPWLGDAVSFAISAMLVTAMARYGASGMVLLRMVGNVFLDYLLGAIPFLGDVFDFTFRANRRNLRLLREHYEEGKHQGSAWWVIGLLAAVLMGLVVLSVLLVVKVLGWLFSWLGV